MTTDTTILIVAVDSAAARSRAKTEGLKRWTGITPDNYRKLLPGLSVPRQQVLWDDVSCAYPLALRDAVGACIRRGNG